MTPPDTRRHRSEAVARLFVFGVLLGLPLAAGLGLWLGTRQGAHTLRARIAEDGGWTPAALSATAGEPLRLRLTSDDVVHGFAIGQSEQPGIDVLPGMTVETTLVFDRPGRYTYYCTRWCGLGHWRMRGTIEVAPRAGQAAAGNGGDPPPYIVLGLDLDAPHPAAVLPDEPPSAARGAALAAALPDALTTAFAYTATAPAEAWQALRAAGDPQSGRTVTDGLSDLAVWDLVAYTWQRQTTPAALAGAQARYAQNCAACHGEAGAGDGVFAPVLSRQAHAAQMEFGSHTVAPADFTDPAQMLGASPAVLHGKIVRGGMGTGMPYWGPIFTDQEIWALVAYIYSFTLRR